MTTNTDQLAACPFCGGTEIGETNHSRAFDDRMLKSVVCQNESCFARVMGYDDEARVKWNRRTPPPASTVAGDALAESRARGFEKLLDTCVVAARLDRCPFCGSCAEYANTPDQVLRCMQCRIQYKASDYGGDIGVLEKCWNTRATPTSDARAVADGTPVGAGDGCGTVIVDIDLVMLRNEQLKERVAELKAALLGSSRANLTLKNEIDRLKSQAPAQPEAAALPESLPDEIIEAMQDAYSAAFNPKSRGYVEACDQMREAYSVLRKRLNTTPPKPGEDAAVVLRESLKKAQAMLEEVMDLMLRNDFGTLMTVPKIKAVLNKLKEDFDNSPARGLLSDDYKTGYRESIDHAADRLDALTTTQQAGE